MKRLTRLRLFVRGFVLINLLWLAASLLLDTRVVPNPVGVYGNFGKVIGDGIFLHILYSLKRIFAGLLLSLAVGVPTGILMARSKKADRLLYPLVYFTYPIPKTALLPVAMLLWGMRDGSKVAIIFLIIVFQVIVAVRDSARGVEPSLYHVVKSVGANGWQIIRHVTLPAVLPALMTSTRISLGTAVSVLFFIEGYGTRHGMGYYILDAWSRINYNDMYAGIIIISLTGFALFALTDLLADRLCGWQG